MYAVIGNKNLRIHTFYFIGEKVGELTHEKIKQSVENKNWIHDITIKGGKMVLACREAGVMLFNIS